MKVTSFSSVLYRFFTALAILALVLAALPVMPVYAANITVNITTDENATNGNCSLREAIIAANTDAAYGGCSAGFGADVITLTSGSTYVLSLAGTGEDAGATGDLDVTDASGLTVTTSGVGTATIDAHDIDRVLDVLPNASLNLNKIVITNGTAPLGGGMQVAGSSTTSVTGSSFTSNVASGAVTNNGGGIYVNGATLNLTSVNISGNRAVEDGGGLYITGASTVTISGTTIENQNAVTINNGAGIYLDGGTLDVSTSIFSGNTGSGNGGAIYVNGGTLTLNNDTFTNNTADDGGAIYHNTTTLLTVTDSTFTSNQATAADGGAINLVNSGVGSSASISGSTFTSNTAADDGGAIFNNSEPFTITTSVFQNNSISSLGASAAWGGAIRNGSFADSTKITLSTFANNSVTHTANQDALGGAIQNEGAAFILANVTFSGNSTNETDAGGVGNAQGGALWTQADTAIHNVTFSENSVSESGAGSSGGGNIFRLLGTVTLANTILANGLANGSADNCGGTIIDGGNNIDFNGGNNCGAGFSNANPNLGDLTGTPAYFPLNSGSSAIDTGSNAICATVITTNNQSQNGITRPVDGDTDGTATCDIGSSEVLDPPPSVTINQSGAQADPTNVSPINFTAVFSEPVSAFVTGDVTPAGTAGATNAIVTEIAPNDGTTYNVAVSGMTNDGTVIASINAGVATDTGGNGSTASTSTDNTVTYDTTAPDTSITAQPSDPSNDSTPTFSFTGSDPGGSGVASFECQLDGGGYAACTSGDTFGPLADGPHTFDVRAIDNAGNTDATPDSYTWSIDSTAPDTTLVSKPTDPSNSANATFTFSSSDLDVVGFECQLDGSGYATCTSGATFGPLADGPHTFDVRAVDNAGNTDATPASYAWTIDTTAPDVTINSQPADPTNSTDAAFTFSSTDGTASFTCDLDGAGYAPCSSGQSYLGLSEGSHTFSVIATDALGNASSAATYTWTIDLTAPGVTIDSHPAAISNSTIAEFTFSSTDGTASFTCDLDGAGYAPCSSGQNYSGLSEGPHTFTVIAKDSAGNESTNSYTWTIDLAVPSVVSVVRASANPTNAASVDFIVTFSESVLGVDVSMPFDDFVLTTPGVTGASITNVNGSGTTYTVTVNTGSGNGTIRLDVVDDDSIKDQANNPLGGAGNGNGNFTTGETYLTAKGFNLLSLWTSDFSYYPQGWRADLHPRVMGDVDGDGKDDIVGFGYGGVLVALSNGTSFDAATSWTTDFSYNQGWRMDTYPRMVGDVNGDGKDDIVGFGYAGAVVALSNGSSFEPLSLWTSDFSYYPQGWRADLHPRELGDVDGDGKDDIVGFGYGGVLVALSNGTGFDPATSWTTDFSYNQGWRMDTYPRMVGDVNGDGKADLVGFGYAGAVVALSNGSSFEPLSLWTNDFSYPQGWRVDQHPRVVGDVNGDGKDDIVGFGYGGVLVALSNGTGFYPATSWTTDFSYNQGWRVELYPRMVGDASGDGKSDLVGFGYAGAVVATSK